MRLDTLDGNNGPDDCYATLEEQKLGVIFPAREIERVYTCVSEDHV